MDKLHGYHNLINRRFAENERQFHFYKQFSAIVVSLLAKADARGAVKQHRRRVNTDDQFRAAMRNDPFRDHGLHAGVLVPVLGHRSQDAHEYSATRDFATRRNTGAHSQGTARKIPIRKRRPTLSRHVDRQVRCFFFYYRK